MNHPLLGVGGVYGFYMGGGTLTLNKGTAGAPDAVVEGASVTFNGGNLINNIMLSSHSNGGWNFNVGSLTNNGVLDVQNTSGMYITTNTLTNEGTIRAQNTSTLSLISSHFINDGMVTASGGANLQINTGLGSKLGNITVDGVVPINPTQHTRLGLGGAIDTTADDTIRATNGADIYLYGSLNNTGKFLNLEDANSTGRISMTGSGSFYMQGGSIEGGLINAASDRLKFLAVHTDYPYHIDNELSNVTLTDSTGLTAGGHLAGLNLTNGGSVTLSGSFVSNNQFQLSNGARLSFGSTPGNAWSFGPDTTFDFGTGFGGTINPEGTTLTLNGTTLTGNNATIGDWNMYEPFNKIVNNSTLSSNQGGTWTIHPYELDNAGGIIEARGNNSVLNLQAVHYTNGSIGAVRAIGDNIAGNTQAEVILGGGEIDTTGTVSFEAHGLGKISLQTTLNLGGGILDAAHLGNSMVYGNGPDQGGYFELSNGVVKNGTLLVDHPVDYQDQRLTFAPATNNKLVDITLRDANNPANLAGLDLRVGSGVRIEGGFTSNNQFDLDRGGSVSFGGDRTFTNGAVTVGSNYRYDGARGGSFNVDGALNMSGSFTVDGKWVSLTADDLNSSLLLSSHTAGGDWSVYGYNTLTNNATIEADGAQLSVGAGGTLTNNGLLQARNGGTLDVSAGALNNQGHVIQALANSVVNVNGGNWSHVGSLLADGGTMNIGGTFSMGADDSIVAHPGGVNVLNGTLNLGSQFLSPSLGLGDPNNTSHITGAFSVNGGRINQGIVNTDDNLLHLANATLDSVTLKNAPGGALTGLNLTHGENILLLNSLTSNNSFALDNGAVLTFGSRSGNWNYGSAYGNAANISFGNSGGIVDIQYGQTLNLAAGATVTDNNMVFGQEYTPYHSSGNLINGTTLDANGTNLLISTGSLSNSGLIEARNGGYAILAAGSYGQTGHILADAGTVDLGHHDFWPLQTGGPLMLHSGDLLEALHGGVFSLQTGLNASGVQLLTTTGAALTADGSSKFLINGGSITGGFLNSTSSALVFSHDIPYPGYQYGVPDNILDGVHLTDATGSNLAGLNLTNGGWAHLMSNVVSNNHYDLNNDAHLVLEGDRTFGSNTVFDFHNGPGSTVYFTNNSLITLNPGVILKGTNATIGATSPYSSGTATMLNNAALTFNQGGTWNIVPGVLENAGSTGSMDVDNHTVLTLGTTNTAILNNGNLNAYNGSMLNLNAATTTSTGSIHIADSTLALNNDTLTSIGALTFAGNSNFVLNQSTFNNDARDPINPLQAYTVNIQSLTLNGATLNNGHLNVKNNAVVGTNSNNYINNADFKLSGAASTLDLTQGGLLHFNNGILTAAKVDLNCGGALDFSGAPILNIGEIHFGGVGNNGLFLEGGTALTFGSGTSLMGNIGVIGDSLNSNGSRTLTNMGTINPDGPGVNTQVKATSFDNQGHINLSNSAHLDVQSMGFQNSGQIMINAGSVMTIEHGLTQNTGLVTINGQLTLAPNTALNITGGKVKGSGLIGGDIDLSGGSIDPGNSPGHMTVMGNLHMMGADGTLNMEIAGVNTAGLDYDWLDIDGTANLNGTLNFSFYNGYNLNDVSSSATLTFLTAQHGLTGQFASVNFLGLSGFDYHLDYQSDRVLLDLIRQSETGGPGGNGAVPEPGAVGLLLSGLASAGWLTMRRLRRQRADRN